MLEDYNKLINGAQKYASKDCEGVVILEDGKQLPSCSLTSETLAHVKVDKPQFKNNEWKEFWKSCKNVFPLHSVCGGAKNISQVEYVENEQANNYNFLDLPIKTLNKLHGGKIFEIGYGYGYFGKRIMDKNTWDADYYGIDYVASDKSLLNYKKNRRKRFYEINTSGIPHKFQKQKFDLIYSVNVMQHLTQKQRKDYFKQVAKMMTKDSAFYFDVFEWNYDVMGDKIRDDYSCIFFGVKTHVDTPDEMNNMLNEAGLYVIDKKIKHQLYNTNETNSVRYICGIK